MLGFPVGSRLLDRLDVHILIGLDLLVGLRQLRLQLVPLGGQGGDALLVGAHVGAVEIHNLIDLIIRRVREQLLDVFALHGVFLSPLRFDVAGRFSCGGRFCVMPRTKMV